MKRVGELYEVVVFTASVSKVSLHDSEACTDANRFDVCSMGIHFSISLIFIMSYIIVFLGKVVTITKGITSR